MKRIAVWNTAFLGDAVLTLPLIQSLHAAYPGAAIDFYARGGLAGLFRPHPSLAAVYEYHKRGKEKGLSGIMRLGREIAERKYDLWVSAHTSLRSGLAARFSKAPVRVGYDAPGHSMLWYTHRIDRAFDRLPEIERLLRLLEPIGVPPASIWPEIALDPAARAEAGSFFAGLPAGPVLGLHPGSVWATKRWPAKYFAAIGAKALAAGAVVLLFAGPGEEAAAEGVRSGIAGASSAEDGSRLFSLAGKLSLPSLAAHIKGLSAYLTNDSGPMHLAWAQHVPVTALFGPTVKELGFFPRGEGADVLEAYLSCRPCGLHGPQVCPLGHHDCMNLTTPEIVWENLRPKLGV